MAEVESFTLDHDKVIAPYVRLIAKEYGSKGDVITNFDVRLTQPNEVAIETGGLHTMEHIFADLMRNHLEGIIDISPFGCRTGFHLIAWGEPSATDVAKALKATLETIVKDDYTIDQVQGIARVACGNYKDHSLHSAKEWAKIILKQGISEDAFVRKVI
ncbi:S-ribosylhomocysteine lyase [Wohlfahrtiimonas chitiniclastica]|uniref:S-ribosylhomocysteine lyase n=1 Tax=Wohlfahrtiimonas chitiniclastica TaxID=400946 RepID=UPI001BD05E10|nr:S-ribosylhomocysteine lyase [Wohlfahrtiimonas chitiniclastica]MBS7838674.1 S-ribosylhomocysteine lyase [Wohlfahrtiimonas chitiniclastica]